MKFLVADVDRLVADMSPHLQIQFCQEQGLAVAVIVFGLQ